MNTRYSTYDSLNSGRQRRQSSMEDLEATLGGIEAKLDTMRARPEPGTLLRDDMAERMRRISEEIEGHRHTPAQRSVYAPAPRAETTRQPETGIAMGSIAAELQQIRSEMSRLATQAPSNDWNLAIRKEMELIKHGLSSLAREDTLRSVESQWNKFAQRPSAAALSDPIIESMLERIESIQQAVGGLPQSQTLVNLEEKIRVLASAVDQLSRRAPESNTAQLLLIEDRLDEISRAIVASSVSVQPSHNDKAAFDRLEARLASLNTRIEDLVSVDHSADVNKRIGLLANQMETIATRAGAPAEQMNRLTAQIEAIASKISEMDATRADPALIASGLEDRLYEIAARLERNHEETGKEAREIFNELEHRLEDMAVRLNNVDTQPADNTDHILAAVEQRFSDLSRQLASNHAEPAIDPAFVSTVERRLEDITNRLNETTAPVYYGDPDALARLEMQVQSLADQLSAPREEYNPLISINPRLEAIEQSLTSSQEAILTAARQAAEDVIRSAQYATPSADNDAALQLANDLKALEALARKSDERNTKTFEAIHDTLLKIVDRLNSVETTKPVAQTFVYAEPVPQTEVPAASKAKPAPAAPAAPKINLGEMTPAFDGPDFSDTSQFEDFTPAPVRSPAEAALAAARAARNDATGPESVVGPAKAKTGFLSGLAAKVRRKEEPKAELELAGSMLPKAEPMLEEPSDTVLANSPIEPGSGTPDLGAIMKRVRDERKGRADGPAEDNAKNDFLAAARRAAQAAAADAEILRNKSSKKTTNSESGIASLLQRQRKPIMMVAFAALLALTGLQLSKAFLGGDAQETAVTETLEIPSVPAAPNATSAQVTPSAPAMEQVVDTEASDVRKVDAAPEDAPSVADNPVAASPVVADTIDAVPADKPVDATQTSSAPSTMAPDVEAAAPAVQLPSADLGPVALREAAASGDPKALFEIASRLADGKGVTKDLKKAADWYQKSADSGFAPSQFRLGSFYEKGTGVERSAQKAKELYQLAAEQGNASAMHNLAVLNAMGAAGPVDNDTAAQWFVKAAELGVKDSQYNLGILAAKGLGVPQNLEESYKWFALAAKAGDTDAATKRDEIANALRPEQLQKARATAELWKAKPLNPAANGVEVPDSWKAEGGQTASTSPEQLTKAIRNIQVILNKQGFDAGEPDGKIGGKTKKAIAAYQKANGMTATGEVDEALITSLLKKVKS